MAYGGAKTIAADVLVQKYLEGRETIDTNRSLVFLGFGLFQVGFVQYMIYSKLFPFIFKGAGTFSQQTLSQMARDTQGLKNVFKQVSLDMLVYHPCLYFPVFYTCQELVNGNVQNPRKTVQCAITKYIPNAVDDWKGLWQIFVPVSIFQNSFCPVHLRVPCVATAGFFYCIILSLTRGNDMSNVNTETIVTDEKQTKEIKRTVTKIKSLTDQSFEQMVTSVRSRYSNSREGIDREEFARITAELGIAEAAKPLFEALDNADGAYPRGSGVVDAVRLVDGLKLLAGRCSPDERAEFIVANARFLPDEVPARMMVKIGNMNTKEFEACLESIRSSVTEGGVGREKFSSIMHDLGLGEVSTSIFEALDDSEGAHPRGSGVVDVHRLVDGLKLVADRVDPEERVKFLEAHPRFVPEEVPASEQRKMANMTASEFESCLASVRGHRQSRKDGVDRDEFSLIMSELGLSDVSSALFEALDDADGLYPRGSGVIDFDRFIDGMKLLSGRCSNEERRQFLLANPGFLRDEAPPRASHYK